MAPHSSTLAWKIPWTRSLVCCGPWGRKESDTTERLHFTSLHFTSCGWFRAVFCFSVCLPPFRCSLGEVSIKAFCQFFLLGCLFLIDLQEFFVCSGYKFLIRYMYCRYLFYSGHSLPFYSLNDVFQKTKVILNYQYIFLWLVSSFVSFKKKKKLCLFRVMKTLFYALFYNFIFYH